MKRLLCVLLCTLLLVSCSSAAATAGQDDGRIKIMATLFPQYDFARNIAGDRADVTLLLPPGTEAHTFEPRPSDIAAISGCDLFLYTGDEMEPWAATLLDTGEAPNAVDLSAGIDMTASEEVDILEHAHESGEHESEHESEHAGHHHVVDPHIWTSPANAIIMVREIADALAALDPEGESVYRANADAYIAELNALDEELFDIAANGSRTEIVFGGRFAFHYFAERYGLTCLAAYDSCSEESEPSAGAVAALIDEIEDEGLPVIYYEEMTNPRVADTVADETGAEPLLLHSCHNLSRDETERGETYLSLMHQNAENLRRGLS